MTVPDTAPTGSRAISGLFPNLKQSWFKAGEFDSDGPASKQAIYQDTGNDFLARVNCDQSHPDGRGDQDEGGNNGSPQVDPNNGYMIRAMHGYWNRDRYPGPAASKQTFATDFLDTLHSERLMHWPYKSQTKFRKENKKESDATGSWGARTFVDPILKWWNMDTDGTQPSRRATVYEWCLSRNLDRLKKRQHYVVYPGNQAGDIVANYYSPMRGSNHYDVNTDDGRPFGGGNKTEHSWTWQKKWKSDDTSTDGEGETDGFGFHGYDTFDLGHNEVMPYLTAAALGNPIGVLNVWHVWVQNASANFTTGRFFSEPRNAFFMPLVHIAAWLSGIEYADPDIIAEMCGGYWGRNNGAGYKPSDTFEECLGRMLGPRFTGGIGDSGRDDAERSMWQDAANGSTNNVVAKLPYGTYGNWAEDGHSGRGWYAPSGIKYGWGDPAQSGWNKQPCAGKYTWQAALHVMGMWISAKFYDYMATTHSVEPFSADVRTGLQEAGEYYAEYYYRIAVSETGTTGLKMHAPWGMMTGKVPRHLPPDGEFVDAFDTDLVPMTQIGYPQADIEAMHADFVTSGNNKLEVYRREGQDPGYEYVLGKRDSGTIPTFLSTIQRLFLGSGHAFSIKMRTFGKDPNVGFECANATYTAATKSLVETGRFATYVHRAGARTLVNGGTNLATDGVRMVEIAAKVSDDELTLTADARKIFDDDSTGVTTRDVDWANPGSNAVLNRCYKNHNSDNAGLGEYESEFILLIDPAERVDEDAGNHKIGDAGIGIDPRGSSYSYDTTEHEHNDEWALMRVNLTLAGELTFELSLTGHSAIGVTVAGSYKHLKSGGQRTYEFGTAYPGVTTTGTESHSGGPVQRSNVPIGITATGSAGKVSAMSFVENHVVPAGTASIAVDPTGVQVDNTTKAGTAGVKMKLRGFVTESHDSGHTNITGFVGLSVTASGDAEPEEQTGRVELGIVVFGSLNYEQGGTDTFETGFVDLALGLGDSTKVSSHPRADTASVGVLTSGSVDANQLGKIGVPIGVSGTVGPSLFPGTALLLVEPSTSILGTGWVGSVPIDVFSATSIMGYFEMVADIGLTAPVIEAIPIEGTAVRIRIWLITWLEAGTGGYQVYRSTSRSGFTDDIGDDATGFELVGTAAHIATGNNVTTYTDASPPAVTEDVYYRVRAVDDTGTPTEASRWSNVAEFMVLSDRRTPVPTWPENIRAGEGWLKSLQVSAFQNSDAPSGGITWLEGRRAMAHAREAIFEALDDVVGERGVLKLMLDPPTALRNWFESLAVYLMLPALTLTAAQRAEQGDPIKAAADSWRDELLREIQIRRPGGTGVGTLGHHLVR